MVQTRNGTGMLLDGELPGRLGRLEEVSDQLDESQGDSAFVKVLPPLELEFLPNPPSDETNARLGNVRNVEQAHTRLFYDLERMTWQSH